MAKRRGKSAIEQHVDALRALDDQFRKFDKKLRKVMKTNPELRTLKADLDRTLDAVEIPAYGFMSGKPGRRR